MSYKFETIAIQHATGEVSRMQIIVEAPASAFDGVGAVNAGFTFDSQTNIWKRTLNQAAIAREISRTSFPRGVGPAIRSKRVLLADFPAVRTNFDSVPERQPLL